MVSLSAIGLGGDEKFNTPYFTILFADLQIILFWFALATTASTLRALVKRLSNAS